VAVSEAKAIISDGVLMVRHLLGASVLAFDTGTQSPVPRPRTDINKAAY
jgi:hypothetical protein